MDDFYSLGLLLSRASVALAKAMNTNLEKNGIDLPHSQFIVLRCLYYKDAISQFEIANLLFKDASAIKRTVDLLEKKHLVVRKPVRALKNLVCITEKGKRIMPQVLEIADSVMNEALNGIETENRELLRVMLDKLYMNLEKK
ncbi:MAG: MarR family transcriptional regulator [Odoribacter sp.]|nr:MarR family transcriptional regulator [Odoribacter sp.]